MLIGNKKTASYASLVDLLAPRQFCTSPVLNERSNLNLQRLVWVKVVRACLGSSSHSLPTLFLLAQLRLSAKSSALMYIQTA